MCISKSGNVPLRGEILEDGEMEVVVWKVVHYAEFTM